MYLQFVVNFEYYVGADIRKLENKKIAEKARNGPKRLKMLKRQKVGPQCAAA